MYVCLLRFVTLLSEWAKYFPHDFRANSMVELFKIIKNKCVFLEPHFIGDLNKINIYLLRKNEDLTKYESYLKNLHYESLLKADKAKLNEHVTKTKVFEVSNGLLQIGMYPILTVFNAINRQRA